MTDRQWKSLVLLAEDMGDKFKAVVERLGKDGVEKFQRMIIARFSGDGVEQMEMSEWVVFVWRYHSELERREWSSAEADKLLQWAIAAWLVDRHQAQLNSLMLGQDERAKVRRDPPELDAFRDTLEKLSTYGTDLYANLGQWTMETGYRKDNFELSPRAAKILVDKVLKHATETSTFVSEVVKRGQEVSVSVENAFSGIAAIADGLDKEHVDYMRNLQTGLEKRQKAVIALESQLGLYSTVADDAGALMKKVLDKAERYRLANPREYEWVCPECDWKGQLKKRQRSGDKLINTLDYWWVWKCPSCGEIIAYDQKHPYFDGKIVFSHKLWQLVKDKVISLANMAFVLETSPEHIVYALRTIYNEELPKHVEEEWNEFDRVSKEIALDDRDEADLSEEMLGDPGEEE